MQRTDKQNDSLHLWFEMVAELLNSAGLDMRVVLKPEVEIPWSKETVKNWLWRPIQIWQVGKKSTTELTTSEIDKIYDVLVKHFGEKLKVVLPEFPSLESLENK